MWETLPFQLNGMARGAPFRLRQVGCARVKANGGVDGSQHHRGDAVLSITARSSEAAALAEEKPTPVPT